MPFLLLFLFTALHLSATPLSISVTAESAILMNADTGAILFEKKARELRYPASITKIATAVFALKLAGKQLDVSITADQDAVASVTEEALRKSNYTLPAYRLIPGGTHMGIKKGEVLTLQDLLFGMMLVSGSDAANVIAQHQGGTIPKFMDQLNAYLKQIGCKNTKLMNPHGNHHPDHQTTAYDMAILMREGLKDPKFLEIISTVKYTRPTTNKQESTQLVQTNRLLRKGPYFYDKAIGGKTGYLSVAGHTLVVAAKQGSRTLIAVLLKSKERGEMFRDAKKLFEAAFNQPKVQKVLLKAGLQKYQLELSGKQIKTYLKEDLTLEYYPAEEPKVKCLLFWSAKELPIKKDQIVGDLRLQTDDGQVLKSIPLFSQEDVSSSWLRRFF